MIFQGEKEKKSFGSALPSLLTFDPNLNYHKNKTLDNKVKFSSPFPAVLHPRYLISQKVICWGKKVNLPPAPSIRPASNSLIHAQLDPFSLCHFPNHHLPFRHLRQLFHPRNYLCPSLWIHLGSSSIPSKIPAPPMHIGPLLPFFRLYPSPNRSDPKKGVAWEGWRWGSRRRLSRVLVGKDRRREVGIRGGRGRSGHSSILSQFKKEMRF